ncbi:esterase B1-like isoform X2 [Cylas formicarius]|uniref:esterase B1-like isoform X2 n=1 Tax=Cylas formicarius TaxID=197179 RepID=UPI002958C512|nr:esterase B1-like isoform X2 [Cylas formicarius]
MAVNINDKANSRSVRDSERKSLCVILYSLRGFLSLEDPSLGVPGNAAFKDMVLALKWVQTNISKFCGDPTNVTIFGNSAGAAAVHFLMLSPMAKGLFHKAICQSGSALSSWAYGMNNGEIMARQMGISYSDEKQILDSLLKASVEELFKAQEAIDKETIKANRFRFIGAVVEDSKTDGELFLTQHPVETLLSGNYNKVPFLVGYNSGDGMIFDSLVPPEENDIYWIDKEYNVPGLLYLKKGSALSKTLGDEIVRYYFGTGKISRETHLKELYNITTDNSFLRGILYSVQNHGGSSATPVYMYKMSLETNLNFYKAILSIELPGVCHADEIGYLFSTFLTETPSPGTVEDTAQRRFVRMWTNFAKFANPTPCRDPLLENVIWTPAVCRDNIPYLDISANLVMRRNPEPDRMKFWKKVYSNGRLVSKL